MPSRAAILVVDDDVTLRTTMCASLTVMGYAPLQAGSVSAALQVLGTEHVDAMILDVQLPDARGGTPPGSACCGSCARRQSTPSSPC